MTYTLALAGAVLIAFAIMARAFMRARRRDELTFTQAALKAGRKRGK